MEDRPRFAEIREDVEARQKATVWPDTLRNGSSVDAFLWRGDPHAKPIQRAGLVVFGLTFLLLAICVASIPIQKDFEDDWAIVFLMALFVLLISMRLFRNSLLRSKGAEHESEKDE
jgi:peptidoglycan/LPS O-acetylase OafA/YrhL